MNKIIIFVLILIVSISMVSAGIFFADYQAHKQPMKQNELEWKSYIDNHELSFLKDNKTIEEYGG